MILLGQFNPSLATALSKVTIFGSAISNWMSFGIRKHPKKDGPLIDYEISLLMEPIILLGTIVGVYFNIMFPYWLILVLLLILLAYTIYKTSLNGIKQWKKEKAEDQLVADAGQSKDEKTEEEVHLPDAKVDTRPESVESPSIPEDNVSVDISPEVHVDENLQGTNPSGEEYKDVDKHLTETEQVELAKMIEDDKTRFPYFKLLILAFCWVCLLVMSLLKGGSHGIPSIVWLASCSIGYWFVVASIFPVFIVVTLLVGLYLKKRYDRKIYLGYPFLETDIKYTLKTSFFIPFICLIAGIISGLLGLGGGLITGPILLDLGVPPEVSVSSSAFMILITSSATVVQFAIFGVIPWDYGLAFCFVGFFGSLLGQFVISYVVKRWGRPSWIVFLLVIIIILSSLSLIGLGVYNLVMDIMQGAYLGFSLPC